MNSDSLSQILLELSVLEKKMLLEIKKRSSTLKKIHFSQLSSAKNLLHYLVLRNEDIRNLQDDLHRNGLSSLASSESHIHSQLQLIMLRLGVYYKVKEKDRCTYDYNLNQMQRKNKILFGNKNDATIPYIMVTFDVSFADNYSLIKNLLLNGMNIARINCAHDNESVWYKMIQHLKKACTQTGLSCKIYMDLAGPKIRIKLLNKGKNKGKVKVKESEIVWLSEKNENFKSGDIVISPTETGIISVLKKGERIFMDDGLIEGIAEELGNESIAVRIIRISSFKQQIKNEKGLNFPDSNILIASLTDFDKTCLPFICKHADMIGYSFVRKASDIKELYEFLNGITAKPPNIIIKIETTEAVKNLPDLLLTSMQEKVFGVMIARGDLAVEIGFERMGEIQEEILWICEAAHVPVIWATQVLETLNKSGIATRSEITDATHAAMAECVMINKGDHTIEVIETLRDILKRTGGHHIKKRYTFRPLSIAKEFINLK